MGDGGGWEEGNTVNVTGTFLGAPCFALIVTVALWVPAASPLILTATVSWTVLVTDVFEGDTVSQEALSEFVNVV